MTLSLSLSHRSFIRSFVTKASSVTPISENFDSLTFHLLSRRTKTSLSCTAPPPLLSPRSIKPSPNRTHPPRIRHKYKSSRLRLWIKWTKTLSTATNCLERASFWRVSSPIPRRRGAWIRSVFLFYSHLRFHHFFVVCLLLRDNT